jgi:adenylylsulfate kinase-like enzyme
MGVLWITGLSGSGKTTFSQEVIAQSPRFRWIHLDGDELRPILAKEQKYDKNSRLDLAKTYSKLASLISSQGHNVIVSTISLFKEIHEWNRQNIKDYYEIFIDVDIELLQKRDIRRVYSSSLGINVMGLDLEYDKPINPDYIFKQIFDKISLENDINLILPKIDWLNEI